MILLFCYPHNIAPRASIPSHFRVSLLVSSTETWHSRCKCIMINRVFHSQLWALGLYTTFHHFPPHLWHPPTFLVILGCQFGLPCSCPSSFSAEVPEVLSEDLLFSFHMLFTAQIQGFNWYTGDFQICSPSPAFSPELHTTYSTPEYTQMFHTLHKTHMT